MQKIDEALSTGPGPRIAVLQGIGGQGKSQIALEYCHRKEDTLYSAIFWIDATTEHSVKGSFQAISEQIKKPTDGLPDIQAKVDFVCKFSIPGRPNGFWYLTTIVGAGCVYSLTVA